MTPEQRLPWLKARQSVLTATDIRRLIYPYFFDDRPQAAVIYDEKVAEEIRDDGPTPILMELGNVTEPYNAELFERGTGFTLGIPEPLSISRVYPWMGASIDREIVDPNVNQDVELKYTAFFNADWGAEDTDHFPVGYHVQTQWQMFCRERQFGRLQALSGGGDVRRYRTKLQEELINPLMAIGYDFWHDFVLPRRRPPEDWQHTGAVAIVEQIREAVVGKFAEIDDPMAVFHCREYETYSEIEKEAEEKKAQAKRTLILSYMGDAETARCGPFLLSRIPKARFLKLFREPSDPSKPRRSKKARFFE